MSASSGDRAPLLAYNETGDGRVILFVHGWPHDHTIWLGQLGGLARHARCLAPDLRGFGDSPSDGPVSIDRYADDLVRFLDTVGVARAVVCGLSMGGYVALALWRRHPERAEALILTGTRASADGAEQRTGRERLIAFVEANGVQALADQQLEKMVGRTTRATRPELCRLLRDMMASASPSAVVAAQRAMLARPDSTPMLRTITVPTLVVAGAEDAIIPPDEQRRMKDAIPAAHWTEVPGAGHVAAFERPGAFNHAVAEFLATLG